MSKLGKCKNSISKPVDAAEKLLMGDCRDNILSPVDSAEKLLMGDCRNGQSSPVDAAKKLLNGDCRSSISKPVDATRKRLKEIVLLTGKEMGEIRERSERLERQRREREKRERVELEAKNVHENTVKTFKNSVYSDMRELEARSATEDERLERERLALEVEDGMRQAEERCKVLQMARTLVDRRRHCRAELDRIYRQSDTIATWDAQVEQKKSRVDKYGQLWVAEEDKGIGKMQLDYERRQEMRRTDWRLIKEQWLNQIKTSESTKEEKKANDFNERQLLQQNAENFEKCEKEKKDARASEHKKMLEFNQQFVQEKLITAEKIALLGEKIENEEREFVKRKREEAKKALCKRLLVFSEREALTKAVRLKLAENKRLAAEREQEMFEKDAKLMEEIRSRRQCLVEEKKAKDQRDFLNDICQQRELNRIKEERQKMNDAEELRKRMADSSISSMEEEAKKKMRRNKKIELKNLYEAEAAARSVSKAVIRKADIDEMNQLIASNAAKKLTCQQDALKVKAEIEDKNWNTFSIDKMLGGMAPPRQRYDSNFCANTYARLGFKVEFC